MKTTLRKLLFSICCILATGVFAPAADIRFLHIDVTEGLSQGSVFAIMQDYKGFMWIGTRDGLNKYDARKFTTYRHNAEDSSSLGSSFVQCIIEDSRRRLWVATVDGLNLYNRNKDNFSRIRLSKLQTNSTKSEPSVYHVMEDSQHQLWVAASTGLYRIIEDALPRAELVFSNIPIENGGQKNIYQNFRYLYEDSEGKIWLCTDQGVVSMTRSNNSEGNLRLSGIYPADMKSSQADRRAVGVFEMSPGVFWIATKYEGIKVINERTKSVSYYKHIEGQKNSLPSNDVRSIVKDRKGRVWIGTFNGLSLFQGGSFRNYYADDGGAYSLSNNSIRPIYEDKRGSIWLGTYFGGLNVIDDAIPEFQNFSHNAHRKNGLNFNVVSSFAETPEGVLVIGTEGGGLNFLDRTGNFSYSEHRSDVPGSLSHNNVKSLCIDSKGDLWVGTYEGGLNLRRKGTAVFEHFRADPADPKSLASNNIYSLIEDKNGDLWIATFGGGVQVKRKGSSAMNLETFNTQNGALLSNMVRILFEDSKGNLWVGSQRGLFLKPLGSTKFITFLHQKGNPATLSGEDVISIHEDRDGQIWVGTNLKGLNRYNPKDRTFTRYDESRGLAGNNIFGILHDNENNLWLSTNAGISCLNPHTNKVRNYNHIDGLVGNEFIHGAAKRLSGGRFAFGSFAGFTIFHPDSIHTNSFTPPVVFTEFRLFNKKVLPGQDNVIKSDISLVKELELSHSQTFFSLEFSVLNFIHADRNRYGYFLKGFDEQWIYVDNPVATYTNLDPGNYELLVKGANNDGVWNEIPTVLKIKILPAPWRTWWAYTAYLCILGLVVYYVVRFFRTRVMLKRQLFLEHMALEKQQEIHEAKLSFFTHISHEFRTPLSLIAGPIERLREDKSIPQGARNLLESVQYSVDRLLGLVNQLLDFRKQESGQLVLQLEPTDLKALSQRLLENFMLLSQRKQVKLVFDCSLPEGFTVLVDPEQLEKVLTNILYNAFKFTPPGGFIRLQLSLSILQTDDQPQGGIEIAVWDSGQGISKEDLPHIFDEFYQATRKGSLNTGSGVGLALSRSLVQMHGGEITAVSGFSDENQIYNTVFRVTLPYQEIMDISAKVENGINETRLDNMVEDEFIEVSAKAGRAQLLIVEDNPELRAFIGESLVGQFDIEEAADGQEAWAVIERLQPDLIISDVMMPKSDGIELLQKIKQSKMTCHIPVILLTARTADPYVLEAYREGTDDYITKPFSVSLLRLKIRNMLAARKFLEERFVQNHILNPEKEAIVAQNSFLHHIMEIVEEHIAEDSFGVEDLAAHSGMSRTVLYRKVKNLSGLNVVEFINIIRLKKAGQLLETLVDVTISEVAYKVGFTDPKYFSKSFKKHFGVTPSQYARQRSLEIGSSGNAPD